MRIFMLYVEYFIFCLFTSFSQHYICCALSCVKLHNGANFLFLSIFLFFSFSFFFFSFHRTGWLFRHLTSPCSQNTAQFILQTLRSLQRGIITHSARSVSIVSRLALFYVTFSSYVNLTALFIDF